MISIFTCTSEESFVVLSLIVFVVVFDAVVFCFFFNGNGFEPSQLHVHVRH